MERADGLKTQTDRIERQRIVQNGGRIEAGTSLPRSSGFLPVAVPVGEVEPMEWTKQCPCFDVKREQW